MRKDPIPSWIRSVAVRHMNKHGTANGLAITIWRDHRRDDTSPRRVRFWAHTLALTMVPRTKDFVIPPWAWESAERHLITEGSDSTGLALAIWRAQPTDTGEPIQMMTIQLWATEIAQT